MNVDLIKKRGHAAERNKYMWLFAPVHWPVVWTGNLSSWLPGTWLQFIPHLHPFGRKT